MSNKQAVTFLITFIMAFAMTSLRAGSINVNLVKNSGFENDVNIPKGYDLWRIDKRGTCSIDNSVGYKSQKSIKVAGVRSIAYQYSIDVLPKAEYTVEALCKQEGKGQATLCIYWKNANNRWIYSNKNVKVKFTDFDGKWKKALTKVKVPAGVARLAVLLSVANQGTDKDVIWFDNIVLKKEKDGVQPKKSAPVVAKKKALTVPHYKNKTRIVPLEAQSIDFKDYKPNRSQREVRDTLRMGVLIYSDISKKEAEKRVLQMRNRGYNAILTEGQRFLFAKTRNHPPFPGVLKGSLPYNELVRHTKIVVDACHKYGMKAYLHLTASAVPASFIKEHQDWMTLSLRDGRTKKVWTLNWACLNNAAFQKEYFYRLENLIRKTGADGLMVDETSTMLDSCGCPTCRRKFKQDTGREIPKNDISWLGDISSPLFQTFLKWRNQNCVNFNKKIKKILLSYVPNGTILSYYALPHYEICWKQHGISIDLLDNFADIIGWEVITRGIDQYWPVFIANLKLIRAVSENKEGNIYTIIARPNYANTYFFWLLSTSQGAHKYWSGHDSREIKNARAPLIQWEMVYKNLLAGLRSFADTAVLISTRNSNLIKNPSGNINREDSYFAICNTLSLEHIPYKAIVDKDIQSSNLSSKAKTIIMMNVGLLSDKETEVIREFVKNGGTLIASAETSLYNERGIKRSNFALADLFGCNYKRLVKGKSTLQLKKKFPVLGDITGAINQPDGFCAVESTSSAKILGDLQKGNARFPGLLFNTYGKGKVIYFAGPPEASLFMVRLNGNKIIPRSLRARDPKMIKLFCNIVKNAGLKVTAENLPTGAVVETYKHNYKGAQGIQVHLLNLTGLMPGWKKVRFPDIKKSLPDATKPIKITVQDENIHNAFVFSPDFDGLSQIPIEKKNGKVICNIPSFKQYMIIYFNQAKNDTLFKLAGVPVRKGWPLSKSVEKVEAPLEGYFDPDTPIVFMESPLVSGGKVFYWDSEYTRFIFNKKYKPGKQLDSISIKMNLKKVPPKAVLEVGGMDDKTDNRTKILIKINGETIFKGRNNFRADQFSKSKFSIPDGVLKPGANTVVLENIERWTDYWGQPFCGIYYAKIINKED